MPKQFVRLFGGESLFQKTVARNLATCKGQYVVSNSDQYFLAMDQLLSMGASQAQFMLEPVGRNTAPAIALACMTLPQDTVVLVTPSDHLVKNAAAYALVVERARALAEQGFLVTFGIKPDAPEIGFGYIEAKGEDVVRFIEKPSLERAQEYVASGNFYWNSGMFCFQAGVFLEELKRLNSEMYQACVACLAKADHEGTAVRPRLDDMKLIPSNSIDYAVMEKSSKVKVVPSDIAWSDLGSFDSMYHELPHDAQGNTDGQKHIAINSHNNLILSRHRQVATIDLENMIVVDTPDALLVAPRSSSQKVKAVVDQLKAMGSDLIHTPQTVARPWGAYTVLLDLEKAKLKKIIVKPGGRLSLQKHMHRSEHWVVLSGMATVTVGDKVSNVRPNESTYIPAGELHRLENQGKLDLVIVEVQVGEYTGEDDIIRIEDDYKRTK
jgi:mannose-1-phosphate guanylyltransferase